MNILIFLAKILPWIGFGKKIAEETKEAIETKQWPDKTDLIETIETLPGGSFVKDDKKVS